jgi:hypothetical protein
MRAGGAGGGMQLHIHNSQQQILSQQQTRQPNGDIRQDIFLENVVVGASQNPRTRRAMGLPQQLVRR